MQTMKTDATTVRTRMQRAAALMCTAAVTASVVMAGPDAVAGVRTAGPKPIAFTHVDVVPMNINSLMVDQTVIVRGDRIVSVGAASLTKIPADATVINADGEYLMPQPVDAADATKPAQTVTQPQAIHEPQAPSEALVQQLQKYVAAGHSPYQALATVTMDAAKAEHKAGDEGSVQAGRVADLLLLTANPLADVANVTHVAA